MADPPQPPVDALILLCDSAQVADGKLYVLGGGITAIGPRPQPLAVALLIEIPWDRANISHQWRLELIDEDGRPVPDSDNPIKVEGRLEAGRPAGARPGTPLSVPLAISFAKLPLEPNRSYSWQLRIDNRTRADWRATFSVRAAPS